MPTVLIVDDEPSLRQLYRDEFEREGYTVLTAGDGQEAVRVAETAELDVCVLDIAMPGMDGIEVLRRILAVRNGLPVILNTAYASYQDDFMTWAAAAYVVKSSDPTELTVKVAEVLAAHAAAGKPEGQASA